jgi:hypothetical protein
MAAATIALPLQPLRVTRVTGTFPAVSLPTRPGGLPIEVSLVARLGRGTGTRLFHESIARQRAHDRFVDALDEPSAKLGGCDFAKGDATSLYTFSVGPGGHPFHRHAGHRVFTAVTGSAGARLRFSSATPAEVAADPASFVRALRHVDLPPDSLFSVRFSGENWHQFVPLKAGSGHPAFFALSTHTNELGGQLSDALKAEVLADRADIASLTELLPAGAAALLAALGPQAQGVPTTVLSLNDRPNGFLDTVCRRYRSVAGHVGGALARWKVRPGYVSEVRPARLQPGLPLPADSLLRQALADRVVHHEDRFTLTVNPAEAGLPDAADAAELLSRLLDSFLAHRHPGVTRLMSLRNRMVKPLRLRTSPLACPVSSLATDASPARFAGRFPVHASHVSADGQSAQVLLGADDRHLAFRSCIEVHRHADGQVTFALSNRVACRNLFGRFYMAAISKVHHRYVMPRLMAVAIEGMAAPRVPAKGDRGVSPCGLRPIDLRKT